jgi:hypothetical protein
MEGVVRLHRIGDMEGVVRSRHPLRGGALCRLDPIYGFGQDLDRVV